MRIEKSNNSSEGKMAFKDRQEQFIEGVELVDDVRIRLVSKEDIECLKSSLFGSPNDLLKLISTKTYLLEQDLIEEQSHEFKSDKLMRNIVLAINLFKEGYTHGDDVFYFEESQKRELAGWSREGPLVAAKEMGLVYVLDLEEMPKLRQFVKKFINMDFTKRKSLNLACNRFQRIYQEYNVEDQLIDCMIAFEALFLKGERHAQSRGRIIAIACSTLLGRNNQEREEIKNTLKSAYSMRNTIIHGGEYNKDLNPFEIVEDISEYLRESIIKFLD